MIDISKLVTAEQKIATERVAKVSQIKVERDRRKVNGVLVDTKWFHSDDASRIQQLGLVMAGANIPTGLQWKTLDGTFVTMTQALALSVYSASIANDIALFAKCEEHIALMEAAAIPANYALSTGWPVTFGE